MFSKEDLAELIPRIGEEYTVIMENGHDVHIHSLLTGHDCINQHDKSYFIYHISEKNFHFNDM